MVLVFHRRYGIHIEYCGVTILLQYEQIVQNTMSATFIDLQPLLKGDGRWFTFHLWLQ